MNILFRVLQYQMMFLFALAGVAGADWINLSGAENAPNIAEIRINEDHVQVELEIYVNDIVIMDRLLPGECWS